MSEDRPHLRCCTFCQGAAVWVDLDEENAVAIECEACGASSPKVLHAKDGAIEEAAARWNERADYWLGRLEGARIVRDAIKKDLWSAMDEYGEWALTSDAVKVEHFNTKREAIEDALSDIPDDAQLQKLIEGEG